MSVVVVTRRICPDLLIPLVVPGRVDDAPNAAEAEAEEEDADVDIVDIVTDAVDRDSSSPPLTSTPAAPPPAPAPAPLLSSLATDEYGAVAGCDVRGAIVARASRGVALMSEMRGRRSETALELLIRATGW